MQIWSAEIKEIEILNTSIKGQISELEKELEQLIKTKDANVVMLYSRRCLEVIITDLCECELGRPRKTEPLKGIIDKLNREDKVPSHIISSMHSLNSLSTYGTHPKDFDPEQVKPVLNNLTIIIRWYLKHKESIKAAEPRPAEINFEGKSPDSIPVQKPKISRKLIIVLTAIILAGVIVVGALFMFNIIGGKDQHKTGIEPAKSIAILPFRNFSGDPGQEWISDGLTDEIINHLFKIKSFDKVVSLSSVLTYKGTDKRLPQIASELKVNYILEGTYKKMGDQIRVTAQLIEPKNDKHLWQNEYDRPYQDRIAIQADIALQIADQVKAFLTDSEKQNIQNIPTTNQEAYDLVQKSKMLLYPVEDNTEIIQPLDLTLKAIGLDPDYGDAYAWAGTFSLYNGVFAGMTDISTAIWDALPFIETALELDPNNSTAHMAMGNINEWGRWDYIKAEKEYSKVLELAPNDEDNFFLIGEFYLKMNQPDKAYPLLKKVYESLKLKYHESSDESYLMGLSLLIKSFILSGNKTEAKNFINKNFKLEKGNYLSALGEDYIWLEEYDSAKLYLESALQHNKDPFIGLPRFQACLALTYNKTENYQKAREIINQLIEKNDTTKAGSSDFYTAWYFSGIGQVDSAFRWLEEAYQSRSPEMPSLKADPVFKNLNKDDRYWDLYKRTGHKAYDEYMKGMKK
jgi:TolB-like protein/Tfp pilus assembly protein PilF